MYSLSKLWIRPWLQKTKGNKNPASMFSRAPGADPEFGKWGCTLLKWLKTKNKKKKKGEAE